MPVENSDHEDFVATLESFKELKSGVSGSRIRKLTDYAISHVNDVETLLSYVMQYSKECPSSHKLGSLYIIDSIVRALMSKYETARLEVKAEDNQYWKGITMLNKNILSLLSDGIEKSDEAQREKIKELINIWDKNAVFDKTPLNAARSKLIELVKTHSAGANNYSSNPSSTSSSVTDSKVSNSKTDEILQNIPKYKNLPIVTIPSDLLSDDPSVQESCLKQLLGSLQRQLAKQRKLVPIAQDSSSKNNASQPAKNSRTTQYVGRESRSDRSRSPPRNKQERSRQQAGSNAHTNRQQANAVQANNHHLYPDEVNVPSNPHFRPKPVSFDPTLPRDHVKVYSRTLFVGGVPQNFKEHDIARMLRQFGEVQSVILNNARKHAFVKVYSRAEAERIMAHFTGGGNPTHGLRIRWAVGFGPRDCCDYQYGYSIIPLARLTEIDHKWSQSAEWGGTGGQPIQSGMAFEEPDIILGEGVSSKAISQKMPTDKGTLGPKSGKMSSTSTASTQYSNISPPPPPPPPSQLPQQQSQNQVQSISQPQYYNQQMYPPAQMMYGQGQMMGPVQQTSPPPQKEQPVQNFDPTAQLHTLMSMLNQQPK